MNIAKRKACQMEQRQNFLALTLLDALEDERASHIHEICRNNVVDASYVPPQRDISPLHYAAGMDNVKMGHEITKLFLENGANPNTLNSDNITPLHAAVIQGHAENVQLLLQYGARVDIKNDDRKTPLHYALEQNDFQLVNMLREKLAIEKKAAKLLALEQCSGTSAASNEKAECNNNGLTPKHNNDNETLYYNFDRTSPYYINITHRRNRSQPKFPKSNGNLIEPESNTVETAEMPERIDVFCLTEENLRELSSQMPKDHSRLSLIDIWREKVQRTKARESILKSFNNAEDLVDDVMSNEHLNFTNILLNDASSTNEKETVTEDECNMATITRNASSSSNNFCNIIQQITEAPLVELPAASDINSTYRTAPELQLNGQPMQLNDSCCSTDKDCYVQMTEVYVHTDDENGLVFYETKVLSKEQSAPSPSTYSVCSQSNANSSSVSSKLTAAALNYETDALRAELTGYGEPPGPITKSTKKLYVRKLKKFQRQSARLQEWALMNRQQQKLNFSVELQRTTRCAEQYDRIQEFVRYEQDSMQYFSNNSNMTKRRAMLREGHLKQSFIYMLLDPRISCNLPGERDQLSSHGIWQRFLESIFYVGKGKTNRPYSHLYQAMKTHVRLNHAAQQQQREDVEIGSSKATKSARKQKINVDQFKSPPAKLTESKKLNRIIDIWAKGVGVVCLHVFHNILPIEAYTREAAIIDALSLQHLTNEKRGVYYGPALNWTMKEKKYFGIALLHKALQIYLAEGESQLSPSDLI